MFIYLNYCSCGIFISQMFEYFIRKLKAITFFPLVITDIQIILLLNVDVFVFVIVCHSFCIYEPAKNYSKTMFIIFFILIKYENIVKLFIYYYLSRHFSYLNAFKTHAVVKAITEFIINWNSIILYSGNFCIFLKKFSAS